MSSVLLYTSGIDSWIAWWWLRGEKIDTLPVYVQLGHRYQRAELESVAYLRNWHQGPEPVLLRGPFLGHFEETDANIPLRNALLALMGSYLLPGDGGINKIFLIAQEGEQSIPDRSPDFFYRMTQLLRLLWGEEKIPSLNPLFPNMTKVEMVKWYIEAGHDPYALLFCFSCFSPNAMGAHLPNGCGECTACFRKWIALQHNDVDCNQCFRKPIRGWSGILEYTTRALRGSFGPKRSQEILEVVKPS